MRKNVVTGAWVAKINTLDYPVTVLVSPGVAFIER